MNETPSPAPRDENGVLLCQQCQKRPVPKSLGTKPRIYCGRGCKQRAYEARRTRSIVDVAVQVALARDAKSRGETEAKSRVQPAKVRDFAESPQVRKPRPAAAVAAAPLWEDPEIEARLARYGIGGDGQEVDGEVLPADG